VGVVIGSVVSGLLSDRLSETTTLPYLIGAAVAIVMVPAVGVIWHWRPGD